VHHEAHAELRLRVLHVADRRPELDRRDARASRARDEEDFTDEDVAARELVDEAGRGRECWRECMFERRRPEKLPTLLAVLEEQGDFVGVDGELRLHGDRLIRVLGRPTGSFAASGRARSPAPLRHRLMKLMIPIAAALLEDARRATGMCTPKAAQT